MRQFATPSNQRRTVTPSLLLLRTATEISNYNETAEETSTNLCSICRVNFEENDTLRTINHCNHCYHINCLDRWFEEHITCPVCRYDIRRSTITPSNPGEESISIERVTIPLNNAQAPLTIPQETQHIQISQQPPNQPPTQPPN
jgi:hypothetical protein